MIDVDDAMKPGAPILHDHIKFDGKPSNIAGTLEHKLGDVEAGFKEADVIVERSFKTEAVHQGYIEPHACLVSVTDGKATIWSSSQGQFMVRAMCALLTGMHAKRHPRHPRRDRRRLRRQDHRLPRAGGAGAGQEVGPAGEDGDDARGSVPRLRPDLGLIEQGQDRRQEGRHASSPAKAPLACRPAPSRARRSAAPPAAPSRPTTSRTSIASASTSSPTAPRSRPTARRARRSAPSPSRCVLDELAEKLGMDPLELRLKNAAKQGTKAAHGPVYPVHRLRGDAEAGAGHPHYKAPLGPTRAAAWRAATGSTPAANSSAQVQHQRGRHGRGHDRPSRHRRLARLDGQHRRRAAGHRPQQGAAC